MKFAHTEAREKILLALDAQHGRKVAIDILDKFEKEAENQVRSRVGFELSDFVSRRRA